MVQDLIGFAVVAGLLTMIPGIDTAQVLRAAALGGPARAYATLLGIMAGVLVWGAAAALGISALLVASRTAYDVLRLIGAVYLVALGARMLRDARHAPAAAATVTGQGRSRHLVPAFWRALLVTLTNPKNGLFYVAMLPQFLPTGVPAFAGGVALAGVHALECLAWFSIIIWSTHRARALLQRPRMQTWTERVSGLALIGFGLRVAVER